MIEMRFVRIARVRDTKKSSVKSTDRFTTVSGHSSLPQRPRPKTPDNMSTKIITYDELKANSNKDSLYILLHEKVYNVTKFIDEHPGGDEVILAEAGKDATEAFEDVGHSDEARALLPNMLIGEFEKGGELKVKTAGRTGASSSAAVNSAVQQGSNLMYFVPLGLLGAYFAWRYYSSGSL
ncbi:hypothetical protein NM688_g6193 [Phlebia brevispora]|uniref:Uncharacterized protein n=1 Tax=Phlebia brevispora TaxID=194682 RepID=A0ACC1SJ01_9APHY|nr:hypothetical protein NM688_g6193 [Phlebia brevispora]